MNRFYNLQTPTQVLFDNNVELLPSVTELFEYELAYIEYKTLPEEQFLKRTAYAKSYNNKESIHFLRYSEIPETITKGRSLATNTYFKNGLFSTGYATHGLFPYRGKFHPQLIKGLINILGIKEGETILDPMSGSGTTNIEASLMGINSLAIDISPFCQLMTKTKYDALSIDFDLLNKIELNSSELFNFFKNKDVLEKLKNVDKAL